MRNLHEAGRVSAPTEEELLAADRTRAIVGRVCSDKALSEVRVEVVHSVGVSALNASFAPRLDVPIVEVARRTSLDFTDTALQWLITHEIGHYWYDTRWRVTRRIFGVLGGVAAVLMLIVVVLEAGATGAPGFFSFLCVIVGVLLALVFRARQRADEARADSFAVLHVGDLAGAEECFSAWAAERPVPRTRGPVTQKMHDLAQTHPPHDQRLAAMAGVLAANRALVAETLAGTA